MRALVHDPAAPAGLRLADVPEPRPAPDEVVVAVVAVSLNYLDVAYRDENVEPGGVPGVDAAGTVAVAAADGSGPPVGTRVTTFAFGNGWAQRRVARTADTAALPDGVDAGVAAALPGAGVTALRATIRFGALLGRRVLVTGASGGVGRFLVQLLARAGAEVVAVSRRTDGLAELGASEVAQGLDGVGAPVFGVADTVGGPLLADAFALLEPGGLALSIGSAGGAPTTFDLEQERRRGGGRLLEPFTVGADFGPDLATLLGLVAAGRLDVPIGLRAPWTQASEAAQALIDFKVEGKAVLDVS